MYIFRIVSNLINTIMMIGCHHNVNEILKCFAWHTWDIHKRHWQAYEYLRTINYPSDPEKLFELNYWQRSLRSFLKIEERKKCSKEDNLKDYPRRTKLWGHPQTGHKIPIATESDLRNAAIMRNHIRDHRRVAAFARSHLVGSPISRPCVRVT